jgi:hypothetical protein
VQEDRGRGLLSFFLFVGKIPVSTWLILAQARRRRCLRCRRSRRTDKSSPLSTLGELAFRCALHTHTHTPAPTMPPPPPGATATTIISTATFSCTLRNTTVLTTPIICTTTALLLSTFLHTAQVHHHAHHYNHTHHHHHRHHHHRRRHHRPHNRAATWTVETGPRGCLHVLHPHPPRGGPLLHLRRHQRGSSRKVEGKQGEAQHRSTNPSLS